MSMYSGLIKAQNDTIQRLMELVKDYNSLSTELTEVLAQHIDVSDYERRLAALNEKGGRE